MKGGRVFRTMRIKEGGERFTNVTRIITKLKDDSTVQYMGLGRGKNKDIKDFNSANVYHV